LKKFLDTLSNGAEDPHSSNNNPFEFHSDYLAEQFFKDYQCIPFSGGISQGRMRAKKILYALLMTHLPTAGPEPCWCRAGRDFKRGLHSFSRFFKEFCI
jgi:hypothetical protein